jgi:hypothetical protein
MNLRDRSPYATLHTKNAVLITVKLHTGMRIFKRWSGHSFVPASAMMHCGGVVGVCYGMECKITIGKQKEEANIRSMGRECARVFKYIPSRHSSLVSAVLVQDGQSESQQHGHG